jgi:hypothetical protein
LRRRWPRRLWHHLTRALWTPAVAWLLFAGVFSLWHVPALYDLALEREEVHTLEHALFLATALIFWAQVIPSRPLHPRMSYPMQAIYLTTAALQSNVLGSVLVFSTGPLYAWYETEPRSASALPVLSDQHLARTDDGCLRDHSLLRRDRRVIGYWLREDERAQTSAAAGHRESVAPACVRVSPATKSLLMPREHSRQPSLRLKQPSNLIGT